MKLASLIVSSPYQENRIFDRANQKLNRDDCLASFSFLKEEFKKRGIDLSTQDINDPKSSDIVIYNDMPKVLPSVKDVKKNFLLILESPLIVKNSWDKNRFSAFNKIFSWNDKIKDGKKFIKINYSFDLPRSIEKTKERKKLCTLISAHKLSNGVNELYTDRISTIRWYEENAPEDFDLYGIGWDRPAFQGVFKIFKKFPFLIPLVPFKTFSSYKGMVDSKKETMLNYKFSFCFENIHSLEGYITEKIFDCMFAGSVPIYWGANNILDYVPGDCFIDRRKFSSNTELYKFIKNMNNVDYQSYQNRIEEFLTSDKAEQFSGERFSKDVVDNICEGIK